MISKNIQTRLLPKCSVAHCKMLCWPPVAMVHRLKSTGLGERQKKKIFNTKKYANFHELWDEDKKETKKKGLQFKSCMKFLEFWGEDHKKRVFITKSPQKKQFLLLISEVIISHLGVSVFELHSSGTKPVTFFGHNSCLGGTIPAWGAQFSFGGHSPGMSLRCRASYKNSTWKFLHLSEMKVWICKEKNFEYFNFTLQCSWANNNTAACNEH